VADESRLPAHRPSPLPGRPEQANLADILERVLDKGIVIAGDIQINLLDIELLTIKLRLLIASVERAQEMGINWWEGDPALSSPSRPGDDDEDEDEDEEGGRKQLEEQNQELRERIERLERQIQGGQGEEETSSRQSGGGGA
jgi:Gas vesicle protein